MGHGQKLGDALNHQNRKGAEFFYTFTFIIACTLLTVLPFLSIGDRFFITAGEDALVENLTAVFGFLGSYVCIQIFLLRRRKQKAMKRLV